MPKAPSPPPAPNPQEVTANSESSNLKTYQNTMGGNTIGQDNPYGSLTYTTTIDPITGLPKYQANSQYSPTQQALFNILQGTQNVAGQTGQQAATNTFGQYAGDPNLVNKAQSIVDTNTGPMNASWERFMAPQRAQLDTALRNQGILPPKPGEDVTQSAYQNAMDNLTNQQQLTKGSWLAQFQPQAFEEAQTNYQLPLMNVAKLMQMGQPGSLPGQILNTPTANETPTDVSKITQNSWEDAMKIAQWKAAQQNATMSMLTGGLGGIAKLGTGEGSTVGGDLVGNIMSGMMLA